MFRSISTIGDEMHKTDDTVPEVVLSRLVIIPDVHFSRKSAQNEPAENQLPTALASADVHCPVDVPSDQTTVNNAREKRLKVTWNIRITKIKERRRRYFNAFSSICPAYAADVWDGSIVRCVQFLQPYSHMPFHDAIPHAMHKGDLSLQSSTEN